MNEEVVNLDANPENANWIRIIANKKKQVKQTRKSRV